MSDDRKSIKIDDRFFKHTGSASDSSTRKVRKTKPSSDSVSASSLRKALLMKLKLKHSDEAKQSHEKLKEIIPTKNVSEPITNPPIKSDNVPSSGEFKGALDYLNNLVDKRKKDRKERFKNRRAPEANVQPEITVNTEVSTSLPESLRESIKPYPITPKDTLKRRPQRRERKKAVLHTQSQNQPAPLLPPPAYSNLKSGGTKPTYRQLHNTTLRPRSKQLRLAITNSSPKDIKRHADQLRDEEEIIKPTGRRRVKKIKRTTQRTFKLGRRGGKIGVLLKDTKTRRKINEEHGKLRKKGIKQVRQYLRDRNLIKAGTTMPNDVARTIFINSVLTGDVHNKNDKLALHNFTHKEETF